MKNYKSKISLMVIIVFILNIVPINVVRAMGMNVNDKNIISTTIVTKDDAKVWAKNKGATETFINLANKYWQYYNKHGQVNPAIAYVQSGIETGYGRFGGVIDETYFNPCGMKNNSGGGDDDVDAHHRFNNWDEGVTAHLDHLALYAGANGYPRKDTTDPRHFSSIKGKAKTILGLEGKWASSTGYGKNILNLYNEIEAFARNRKKPKMNLEEPINGSSMEDNTLRIKGWALNGSGVKEVKMYVDNTFIGNATTGITRTDVDNKFPGYPGGDKSGFAKDFDISKFSAGKKVIKAEVIGNDGSKDSQVIDINLKKKPSKMNLEDPQSGLTIENNNLEIRGWALNGSGVKEVKIYVDNKYIGNATTGIARSDVSSKFPGYPGGDKSGFKGNFDISKITAGEKVVKAEVIGNDDSKISQSSKFNIKRKSSKMNLEDPHSGLNIEDNMLKIRGWALNGSGIKEVKIYIDNTLVGNATLGIERPDVNSRFPGYPGGDKSGFNGNFDISKLSKGEKVVKAEVIGNDGSKINQLSKIHLKKKSSKMNLEDPRNDLNIEDNTLNIRGWALNGSGVKEVKIYVNNEYVGNSTLGIERTDVNGRFPGYPGGDKSGFNGKFDISKFGVGEKIIKAEVIGYDDSTISQSSKIIIKRKSSKMNLEDPVNGLNITDNTLNIRGWALNGSGVKEVKIYVDNEYVGNTTTGITRTDVNNRFPGYPGGDKSGFTGSFDMNTFAAGKKVVKAEVIGNDGSKISHSSNIHLKKKSPKMNLEDPVNDFVLDQNILKVRGWALNDSGIKEVKIYLDDKFISNATIGVLRPDVNNTFPGYIGGDRSGFTGEINVNNVSNGPHKIMVKAIGYDNTYEEVSRWFDINNKKLIVVDPGHNYGGDYGSEATHNGIKYSETELDMEVAIKLQKNLEDMGYIVVLTRSPFERPKDSLEESISKRVNLANDLNADLFLSIHHDSSDSPGASGVTTFYSSYKPGLDNTDIVEGRDPNGYNWYDFEMDLTPTKEAIKGRELSKVIVDNLSKDGGFANRREHDRGLGVTRRTNMPAVLIECGFISNPDEAKKCADPKQQEIVARSIANSVKQLF